MAEESNSIEVALLLKLPLSFSLKYEMLNAVAFYNN